MSQLDIKRTVENIPRNRTNVYTPIVEAISNAIDSVDQSGRADGAIEVIFKRSAAQPLNLDNIALADISDVRIVDNGIGFTDENTESFDTLYTNQKVNKGGKGFGRFTYLKYFENVKVESIFKDNKKYKQRDFDFGFEKEIVINEQINESTATDTRTTLYLNNLKIKDSNSTFDKKIETISKHLLEKLLIYFINDEYKCPKITIREDGKSDGIVLNDSIKKENGEIQLLYTETVEFKKDQNKKDFLFKVFKIYSPSNKKSKISLAAHNREVTDNALSYYVPEFSDDFYDEFETQDGEKTAKNYIVKTYVMGEYLDEHVSLERSTFNFEDKPSILYDFCKDEIEKKAADITKKLFTDEVKMRSEKKLKKIQDYVTEEAPWNKEFLDDLDISSIPYNLDNETIEIEVHKAKFKQERIVRAQVKGIVDNPDAKIDESVNELINKISKVEMSELAHYVALRKTILILFKKSLELGDDGKYSQESAVHNIIFPTKKDSLTTSYTNHNLWIIDEKLNFTEYVSSDKPLNGGVTERVDLLVFNKQMMFRGGDDAGNPITIFEFKKPQRDDFADKSSKEDPVDQVIRYVNDIKEGKYKTPTGRDISVADNTPFYGFVICDLTQKVKDWLFKNKDFKQMPDGKGWYRWYDNNNLYVEVISWDKVLRDAELRNKIFFDKLGINN